MIKVAFIGAGSIEFTRNVVTDLCSYPEFHGGVHLSLHDISAPRLAFAERLARQIVAQTGSGATVSASPDRRAAVKDAQYVINEVQVGGYDATRADFDIPARYGVRQTIADTLGIGGIFRGLRTIPVVVGIARDMLDQCPDAYLLNYSNPMAMLPWAVHRGTSLRRVFGLCQQHAQKLVTLGGINLVAQLLILGVMMLTGGATLVSIMMNSKAGAEDPAVLMQAMTGASLAILIGATLFSVLLMAMQFAPMLVVFGKMAPVPAMKASLRAFLRNMIPLTAYGLLLLPFAILASLPMMLGWLVLLPVIITSLYAIYRDLFPMEEDVATTSGTEGSEEAKVVAPGEEEHF